MKPPATLADYENLREIRRAPQSPYLTISDVNATTKEVFAPVDIAAADLIFIFGSSEKRWDIVASLAARKLAPLILVTGRAGEDFYETGQPQSHRIRDALVGLGVAPEKILVEDQSDNTFENVNFARRLLEALGIHVSSILFVCKAHHSGRAWRTLKLAFPGIRLSCSPYEAVYSGIAVRESDWWQNEVSRSRVYGELKRIEAYAARGHIASFGPNQPAA